MLALEPKQSRVYQDAKAEGKAEGSDDKSRSLTWRVLNKKITNLPADVKLRFDQLSVEQIDRLAEDLLSFNSIADVLAWLDLAQPDRKSDQ